MKKCYKMMIIVVAAFAVLWIAIRLIYPIDWEDSHIHAKQYGQMLDWKETLGSTFFLISDAEAGTVKLLHYPHSRFFHRCRLAEVIDVGTDGEPKNYGFGDHREIFAVRIEDHTIQINSESVKKRGLHISY